MGRRHAVRVVDVVSIDQLMEGEQENGETGQQDHLARHVAAAVVDLLGWVRVELALIIIIINFKKILINLINTLNWRI